MNTTNRLRGICLALAGVGLTATLAACSPAPPGTYATPEEALETLAEHAGSGDEKKTIEMFGAGRCMFASNYPVDGLRVGYGRMFDDYRRMTKTFTPGERRALFHDNAARFYRL